MHQLEKTDLLRAAAVCKLSLHFTPLARINKILLSQGDKSVTCEL